MIERAIAELLIGESDAVRAVRQQIARIGPTTLPVLIQGPTGSGKELVARALHLASRRSGMLVAVNVCAIADGMFEDALFGHVRGAFSGAVSDAPGFLAEADRGSIFLDEIGGLPRVAQAKLLRAIEVGEYRPVGARRDRRSDFRVITAANENLFGLATSGAFRADLLHRLAAVVIHVPGLDARVDDIPLLARHFARRAAGPQRVVDLSDAAARHLRDRPWPGNVRELRHVVECAVALTSDGRLRRDDVAWADARERGMANAAADEAEERRRLIAALEARAWNIADTAAHLRVHRATLSRWMRRLQIHRPSSQLARGVVDDAAAGH